MRAAPLVPLPCSACSTLSRTNRPVTLTAVSVTSAVLPRTCATVLKFVPSVETCRSKSCVSHPLNSPPAPACRIVTWLRCIDEPRSTWRNLVAASEQNLSPLPPETDPLTALSGVSVELHGADPVAGLFSARLPPGGGDEPLP